VATVYLGISAAMLLGIPLGTVAANALGWRGAFWALSLLAALVAVLLQWVMPTTRATAPVSLRTQARILRDPAFVGNVLLSVTVFTAMFTGYTYLAEFLETAALVPAAQVGWWLMGFGAVGLAGNWLGGRWVDRHPLGTTALFSLILAGGMLAAMGLAATPVALALALGLWGVANTALYPICQIRVMKSAPQSQALAGTINVSAANGGIALGAFLGGASLSSWGVRSVTLVGAGLAVLAAVVAMALGRWLQTRAATQAG
jgi:predicted MFS family arabinose efflux permease